MISTAANLRLAFLGVLTLRHHGSLPVDSLDDDLAYWLDALGGLGSAW